MFGQSKVAKWLCILALFCFCICGQSLAEEETVIPEEGMRLIAMPRNTTAADSVLSITEAYITCDHSMLTLGEEAVWTLNLKGGVSEAYTIDYILLRHAPTDPKNVYTLYSQEMGTTALSYTSLPTDTGAYLLQVFIRDQYEGVLEVFSGAYTTDDDAALTQKIAEVLSLCKNSGATTELEIALFMHDYLINHADYDQTYTHYSAHGVLLYGSGTCQSYTSAYQILLNKSGMQCLWVDGDAGGEGHCWNIVKIDGVWYQVDCTWDDPIGGNERHDYFLITDQEMAKDHQWNEAAYPACTDSRYINAGNTEQTYAGFTFNGGFGDITIKSYTGMEKNVVVPATINGRKVKQIANNCFNKNTTMETLVISEGVECIEALFAQGCSKLKSISIPATANLVTFDSYGITGLVGTCEAMEIVTVADGNPYLQVVDNVLYDKGLTKIIYYPTKSKTAVVHVPNGVQTISSGAFENNPYLQEVILPDSLLSIGYWAFYGCSSLGKVNIPANCTYIGQYAIYGTKISEIHIPAATTEIVFNALQCANLRHITVDENNPDYYAIDDVLFSTSGVLKTYAAKKPDTVYRVPDNVGMIGQYAFAHAHNLKEVIISETVTSLAAGAFLDCRWLGKLVIPSSVTSIPDDLLANVEGTVIWGEAGSKAERWAKINGFAFRDIHSSTEIGGTYGKNITWRITEEGILHLTGTGSVPGGYNAAPWFPYLGMIRSLVVADGITSIGNYAFSSLQNLVEVHLPESVKSIGENAFSGCSSLESIKLPDGISKIADYTFYRCESLKKIVLPANLKEIGTRAFAYCTELTTIDLPDGFESLSGYWIFQGCTSLTFIRLSEKLNYISSYAFTDSAFSTIVVPSTMDMIIVYNPFDGLSSTVYCRFGTSFYNWAVSNGVNVKPIEMLDVVLPDDCILQAGTTIRLSPNLLYQDTSYLTWYVSDPSVAAIQNNLLTVMEAGTATIRLSYNGTLIDEMTVTVVTDRDAHEWDEGVIVIQPSCKDNGTPGLRDRQCSYCKLTKVELIAAEHSFDRIYVNKEPTCTAEGVKNISCTKCNYSYQEMMPMIAHTEKEIPAKPPTCTSYGETEGVRCSYCGKVLSGISSIPPTGHSFDDGVVTQAPTCTANGVTQITCTICGWWYNGSVPKLGHTEVTIPGIPPTATTPGLSAGRKCSTCGMIFVSQVEIPPTGHRYDSGVVTLAPTCTATGVKTFTCSECGDSYTETLPALGHTEEVLAAVAPTCTEAGMMEGRRCITCGAVFTEQTTIPPLGHNYGAGVEALAPTCAGAGLRIYTCTVCSHSYNEVIPAKEHHYVAGEAIVTPTCTVEGKILRSCEHCGHSNVETIPALGHTEEIIPGIPATGTTSGLTEGKKCSVCGIILVAQTEIPPTDHSYDTGVVTLAPTCTASGVKTFTCTKCGDRYTETISALGHTEEVIPGIPATGTTSGLTEGKKCSVCGIILVAQTEIPPTGHSYDAGVVTLAPTCTAAGKKTFTCSECGDRYTETIPALGHAEEVIPGEPATCTSYGWTEGKVCSVCGVVLVQQTQTPPLVHSYNSGVVTVEPTCTTTGLKTFTCSCGVSKSEMVPALGHIEEPIPDVLATCTTTGRIDGKRCSVCGAITVAQTEVPSFGHSYDNGVVTLEPHCLTHGLMLFTCSACGCTQNEIIPALGHIEEDNPGYPATCSDLGRSDGKRCSRCGYETVPQTYLDALGHKLITVIRTPATCTQSGLQDTVCERCGIGFVIGEGVPPLGHKMITVPAVSATCTTEGWTEYTVCERCDVTSGKTTVPPLGHNYGTGVAVRAPTCTGTGVNMFTCAICLHSYTEIIPALGHTEEVLPAVAPTCYSTGKTEGKVCSVCGTIIVAQTEIPDLLPHTYDDGVITLEPSCTTEGRTTFTCTGCGLSYDWTIKPTAHTEGEKEVITEPTATEPGLARISCSVCGETMQEEEIPALGETRLSGDANGDGMVDLFDALAILKYDVGWDADVNLINADVNGDGAVDLFDALLILQYDVGWDVELL